MLASTTAAVLLVAASSQIPVASALKLTNGPKSEPVDLQKEAKTLSAVLQSAGSKVLRDRNSSVEHSITFKSTEIRTLSAIVGRWLHLQNKVTTSRNPLSTAQHSAFAEAVEDVAVGRVLLGNLLVNSGGDGQVVGQKELLEACPVVLRSVRSSLGVTSEGWLTCYVSLPELLPMTDLPSDLAHIMQSLLKRIPWLVEVVRTAAEAQADPDVSAVIADFTLRDRTELASQMRAAWDVVGRLRSAYRASILSFFNSATKAAQLEAFTRVQELQEQAIAEYLDRAGFAAVEGDTDAPAAPSKLNVGKLQRQLSMEIRKEAAMYLAIMQEVIDKGDVSLDEFKRGSEPTTLGFQSRNDVAAVFEEVYQQIVEAEREAQVAAGEAASFKDSKAAKPSKSRRSKSSRKQAAEPIPPTTEASDETPPRKRHSDSKRTHTHSSSKPTKPTAPTAKPAPPMSMLQSAWSLATFTSMIATMLAVVAAVGGHFVRAARAKQQKLAKAKKDIYLRPTTAASGGAGTAAPARRSALVNKSYLAMPLNQLINKIEVEQQNTVHSYATLVQENIMMFAEEVYCRCRAGLLGVYATCLKRWDDLQQSPWITKLLDYAEGKDTKFPVSLPAMLSTGSAQEDAQDVITSLLVELEAEVVGQSTAKAASRKHKHGSKARRANKPKAKAAVTVGVETQTVEDGEQATAEAEGEISCGPVPSQDATEDRDGAADCLRQHSEDSAESEGALNISTDSGYSVDVPPQPASSADDDGDVDPILLEELMASMQGYAEAVAAASGARNGEDEGEWISTGATSRRNRGQGQNSTAKQLHRQQLLRKTAEALFVGNKTASNRPDAWRNAKWDKIKTAAMKRFISGVPNPLTVSPDTVAASTLVGKPPAGSSGDAGRAPNSQQYHHPIPVRLSAAAVANMHHAGIATAAPRNRHAQVQQASQQHRPRTLSAQDSLRVHHPQQSRNSDEGEQSSLTDSDTSEVNQGPGMANLHEHPVNIPTMDAGQVPMMPNPMESNSVYQYCSMLQHYYQQQCNMMSNMGWTYVLSSPMPVATAAPEYPTVFAPVNMPPMRMAQPMQQMPMPMQPMPMQQVPVMSAAQNAAFPPLPNGRMQRARSMSSEYFQPIQGQAVQSGAGQYAFGSTSNSTPTLSPYYSGDQYENRFTPSPGLSLSTAMLAGSGGAGAIGPAAPVQHAPVDDVAVVTALRKQIEYYFSADNLLYDTYLRHLMDDEGFVHLSEIANFRRVVKLNVSAHQMLVAVYSSGQLEVTEPAPEHSAQILDYEGRLLRAKIRCAEAPTRWVIPADASTSPVSASGKRARAVSQAGTDSDHQQAQGGTLADAQSLSALN